MEPFHKRMAELWWKFDNRRDQITEQDAKEWYECHQAHYNWTVNLSRLESLADLAHGLEQWDWENEIGRKIDHHLINTTGGN